MFSRQMKANKYFDIKTYQETAGFLKSKLPEKLQKIKLGIVCGSGLGGLVDCFDDVPVEFHYTEIPHFIQSTVPGHAGKLVFGHMSGIPTVCMLGRMHFYEGHQICETAYPIRIMRLLGADKLIVTNAAGGLNPNFNVGDFMIIQDHVSFAGMAGQNPLIGPNIHELGTRFPPVSDSYDFELRVLAAKAALELQLDGLREGTYTFVCGPSFETRAEARFLRDGLKGDCVGMSTIPEVIVAKHCGLKVLGISMITNKVSVGKGRSAIDYVKGIQQTLDDELTVASHEEVLETSKERSVIFTNYVKKIISLLQK
jgi:purine-nucleoside phosphorylase